MTDISFTWMDCRGVILQTAGSDTNELVLCDGAVHVFRHNISLFNDMNSTNSTHDIIEPLQNIRNKCMSTSMAGKNSVTSILLLRFKVSSYGSANTLYTVVRL